LLNAKEVAPWRPVAGMVMTDPEEPPRIPRFESEAKVRVRYGVTDPDFEDIPLGGWAGTIETVEIVDDQITYEVEWDRKTLDGMHPVYKNRCERDGLDLETMWLGEEDLEADDGKPVPIEQPTNILTPPLSERDQDDRVRKALGLTHDDPIPEISLEALLAYHRYLTAGLKFPFTGYCGEEEIGPFSRKRATTTVTGLLDPERGSLDVEDGLLCTGRGRDDETVFPLAEIEVGKKGPNSRLISDYAYWFHNWPCRDESDIDREDDGRAFGVEIPPQGLWHFTRAVIVSAVGGGILGATIGAAVRTFNGSRLAAMIGGIPLGMIGAFILGRYGIIAGAVNRLRYGALLGAVLGSLGGGLVGVVAGLTVVALPWSLLGLIVGMFLVPYVLPQKRRRLVSFRAAAFGTCGGILISAFRQDRALATAGAIFGAIIGLIVAAGLVLLLVGAVYLTRRAPMGDDGEADECEKVEEEGDDPGGLHLRQF
jgi:hypothetical protein